MVQNYEYPPMIDQQPSKKQQNRRRRARNETNTSIKIRQPNHVMNSSYTDFGRRRTMKQTRKPTLSSKCGTSVLPKRSSRLMNKGLNSFGRSQQEKTQHSRRHNHSTSGKRNSKITTLESIYLLHRRPSRAKMRSPLVTTVLPIPIENSIRAITNISIRLCQQLAWIRWKNHVMKSKTHEYHQRLKVIKRLTSSIVAEFTLKSVDYALDVVYHKVVKIRELKRLNTSAIKIQACWKRFLFRQSELKKMILCAQFIDNPDNSEAPNEDDEMFLDRCEETDIIGFLSCE